MDDFDSSNLYAEETMSFCSDENYCEYSDQSEEQHSIDYESDFYYRTQIEYTTSELNYYDSEGPEVNDSAQIYCSPPSPKYVPFSLIQIRNRLDEVNESWDTLYSEVPTKTNTVKFKPDDELVTVVTYSEYASTDDEEEPCIEVPSTSEVKKNSRGLRVKKNVDGEKDAAKNGHGVNRRLQFINQAQSTENSSASSTPRKEKSVTRSQTEMIGNNSEGELIKLKLNTAFLSPPFPESGKLGNPPPTEFSTPKTKTKPKVMISPRYTANYPHEKDRPTQQRKSLHASQSEQGLQNRGLNKNNCISVSSRQKAQQELKDTDGKRTLTPHANQSQSITSVADNPATYTNPSIKTKPKIMHSPRYTKEHRHEMDRSQDYDFFLASQSEQCQVLEESNENNKKAHPMSLRENPQQHWKIAEKNNTPRLQNSPSLKTSVDDASPNSAVLSVFTKKFIKMLTEVETPSSGLLSKIKTQVANENIPANLLKNVFSQKLVNLIYQDDVAQSKWATKPGCLEKNSDLAESGLLRKAKRQVPVSSREVSSAAVIDPMGKKGRPKNVRNGKDTHACVHCHCRPLSR